MSCVLILVEKAFLDGYFQLFSIELIGMFQIDEFLQLERVEKRMYSLNLFAFELSQRKCVDLLDVKYFTCFSHLRVKFIHLLWKCFLILLLGS